MTPVIQENISESIDVPRGSTVIDLTKKDGLVWYKVTYVVGDKVGYGSSSEKSVILNTKKIRASSFANAVKRVEEDIYNHYIFANNTQITFIKAELEVV